MNQLIVCVDKGVYYRATVHAGGYLIIEKSYDQETWEELAHEVLPATSFVILTELLS